MEDSIRFLRRQHMFKDRLIMRSAGVPFRRDVLWRELVLDKFNYSHLAQLGKHISPGPGQKVVARGPSYAVCIFGR
jgi:hypothetical protein